jgi:CRISPR-associated endoribonuclease Cas6
LRVRIVFSLKNRGSYVPFHHQYLIAQFIKGVLVFGSRQDYRSYALFNFSGLKGQTKVSRKGLHFYSSKVTLVFACSEPDFLEYFLHELFLLKEIMVGNLQLVPESYEQEKPVSIGEEVKFLCISPIVTLPARFNDEASKRFIIPGTDEFSDLLYDSTISRMEATGRYSAEQLASFYKFQLVPDQDYIQRLQDSHKKFARIYPLYDNDVKFEVRGYTFPFTLFAAKEVQHFLYENGLGLYTAKGFGMLDVANHNTINRNEPHEALYA